jgi:hypothetical protein
MLVLFDVPPFVPTPPSFDSIPFSSDAIGIEPHTLDDSNYPTHYALDDS